jgi:hypothetical protein
MQNKTEWNGKFIITIKNKTDTEVIEIKNVITNTGLNMIRDALAGLLTDGQLKYLAVGTSSTAISFTDTQLGGEFFRTQFVDQNVTSTGVLNSNTILLENEGVGQIQEIGIFAGSTASSAINSGIMISRILFSRNKTNLESIQFQRVDTIGRG